MAILIAGIHFTLPNKARQTLANKTNFLIKISSKFNQILINLSLGLGNVYSIPT
jgi:hypothetical protein